MVQYRNSLNELEEEMKIKDEEYENQKQALDKAMKELTEMKKKSETVP